MSFRRWLPVVGYAAVALIAFLAIGAVAYKLFGLAGWIGLAVAVGAILLNGVLSSFEDDEKHKS